MNFNDIILYLEDKYVEILHNTTKNFQRGNAYFDDGYAHIVSVSMSDAVIYICLPCGATECLYV